MPDDERERVGLLDHVGDGVVVLDRDLRYTYVNRRAGELFGRNPESLLGRLYLEEYPEARGSPLHRACTRALEERETAVFEDYYEPWDRWFESRVHPSGDGIAVLFTEITGRKRAERAGRDANELLAAVYRSVPVAFGSIAPDGTLTSWSPAGERVLGWTEEELVGKGPVIVPEELLEEAQALYARAAAGETVVGVETKRLGRDGSLVDISLSLAPLRDEHGALKGIVGVLEDISERKRALDELRASIERLRLVTEGAQMGFWEWSAADGVGTGDERTSQIFGIELPCGWDEFIRLVHPDDRVRLEREFGAVVENETPFAIEYRMVTEAGETRWIHAAGSALRGEPSTDASARVLGVVFDITERRHDHERLEAALERMRLAASSAGMGVWDVNLDTLEMSGDPVIESIFGLEPGSFGGTVDEVVQLIHEDDRDLVRRTEAAALARESEYDVEYRIVTPDGETHWVHSAATVIVDDEGRPVRMLGVATDITERKRAESELRMLTEELEQRVVERTAEVAAARAEAERANAAKSEFLARMSHELRTPLHAILGFAQLLEHDELSVDQHESVDRILDSGRHLLELVEELLDVSTIEAGALELVIEAVDLASVVEQAVELVQPIAVKREVSLAGCPSQARETWVVADRQRLFQIVLNLLSNAVKYNRRGGRVDIACQVTGAAARLEVSDTGPGLDEASIARIFMPFERLGARSDVAGTGLGLSVAKALVEAMDGSISVTSKPGEGARFEVELPLAEGVPGSS